MDVCRKVLGIKQVDEFEGFDPVLEEVRVLFLGRVDPIFQIIHLRNILRFLGASESLIGDRAVHPVIK